ncbi:MAG: hypothetical protein IKQ91_04355 [Oscillospiraceae bacterium]|nr:hypothetical protein [Oscillospiraceae bacterium]
MRKTKMMNRLVAVLAAVMAAASMASISASAISTIPPDDWRDMDEYEEIYDIETGIDGDKEYWRQKQLREKYGSQLDYLESRQNTKKKVTIYNYGLYHAKNVKLYGRKCLGVDDYGDWILGDWELICSEDSLHGCTGYGYNITGDYFSFAFSFDITWGTDFPYSGVFLDQSSPCFASDWNELNIEIGGAVRSASVVMNLDDNGLFADYNCSSHSEWKP